MAVKERLRIYGPQPPIIIWNGEASPDDPEKLGEISVEIVNGNVVITVERIDEAKFGPVSVVVV